MTSSRGANIPSEPTRSFSKHMRAVDTLTPSPPTRRLLPTFYTPAASLHCANTRSSRMFPAHKPRDVRACVQTCSYCRSRQLLGCGFAFFPLLRCSWWMNGSRAERDVHFSTATFGHQDSLTRHGCWALRQVKTRVAVDGWVWFLKGTSQCLLVATWWMTISNLCYSLLKGLAETACMFPCVYVKVLSRPDHL